MASALSEASVSNSDAHTGRSARRNFWTLTLGSIGVVYGDIGTSPLYAVRELVLAARGASETANAEIILGILSLIIWALILVVTVKYVLLLLRADNDGEGGTLALMALAQRAVGGRSLLVLSLGIIGAALFYGDAMLTPAVSVLSAVEGLEIAAPGLQFYVVPLTVLILVALFAVQSRGTASVAAFFGPITLIWFRGHRRRRTLAHLPKHHRAAGIQSGLRHIFSHEPRVDRALDSWGRVSRRHRC